ncbi:FecR family protein [Sphingobacterium sp. HMA12]|uniref:FecR family protein n=1 Tax=Sphingobacterium sp. HMA12 TaxID=2050894 RepID=UPI000CEA2A36|nr:FecR family protein [Sphingobacterium sp. HMA12]
MDLERLYSKFLGGTCSDAELRILLEHFESEGHGSLLGSKITATLQENMELSDPALKKRVDRLLFHTDSYFEALLQNSEQQSPKRSSKNVGFFRYWKYCAAAAALIVCAITGLLFWQHYNLEENSIAKTPQMKKFGPGTDRAVLTLADGKQIVLLPNNQDTIRKGGNVDMLNGQDGLTIAVQSKQNDGIVNAFNTLSTPNGTQYKLQLADGTKVWLNAGSSLKFPSVFNGKTRQVELSGEAYFEVAHRTNQPFAVALPKLKVEVLGTHFNVKAYPNETNIETTLLQGAVKVTTKDRAILLRPGQQSRYNQNKAHLEDPLSVDAYAIAAWRAGVFSFNNTDISEVLRQLSRWYNIPVVFRGQIPNRKFSGGFERQASLEQVIQILKESNINCTVKDNKLIIYE